MADNLVPVVQKESVAAAAKINIIMISDIASRSPSEYKEIRLVAEQ